MSSGKPVTVAIAREVHTALIQICKSRGVENNLSSTVTQALKWFAKQPDYIRSAITADMDMEMQLHYAYALEKLAEEIRQRVAAAATASRPATDQKPHEGKVTGARVSKDNVITRR